MISEAWLHTWQEPHASCGVIAAGPVSLFTSRLSMSIQSIHAVRAITPENYTIIDNTIRTHRT